MSTLMVVLEAVAWGIIAYCVTYVGLGLLGNVLTFIRYRRMDGKDHPSIRQ